MENKIGQKGFHELSYKKHEVWYNQHFPTEEDKIRFLTDNNPDEDNVGNWLQQIFFSCIDPLLGNGKQSWLTIGDAYGFDAHYILRKPNQIVTASDLNEDFLRIAKAAGLITNFASENAEKLSFADDSFDFVLCKETYHHFPRPYAALYEMIRVAKKGILIIEPQDPVTRMPFLLAMINILEKIKPSLAGSFWKNQFSYEPVGNFVYKVSEREFQKFGAGLGLKVVAFKSVNPNFYKKELQKMRPSLRLGKFRVIWIKKRLLDLITELGFIPGQVLATIVFKQCPAIAELKQLADAGYKIVHIPDNPYR